MKRLIIVLSMVAVICCVGFAEEMNSAEFKYKTVSGGFWSCGQDFSGGFGEFGFNLRPQEKVFVFRDCIFFQGLGGKLSQDNVLDFGGLEIGDKLILGGRTNCSGFIVRTYGYTSLSFGLYRYQNHPFLSAPFGLNLGFGGGFEFQYCSHSAFVVEFGGKNRFLIGGNKEGLEDYSKSSPVLTIGFRTF